MNIKTRKRKTASPLLLIMLTSSSLLKPACALMNGAKASLRKYRQIRQRHWGDLDDLIGDLLENPPVINQSSPASKNQSSPLTAETDGWKTIDWKSVARPKASNLTASPVDITMILDKVIHIKRDDQMKLPGSHISGNKARKMLSLNSLEPFPRCIVSYGGHQSNAMLALAAVVHFQNEKYGFTQDDEERRKFVYFTKNLPRFLRKQPSGNLFRAQTLGMELVELPNSEYNELFGGDSGGSLTPPPLLNAPDPVESVWIPQGGACGAAVAGTQQLAEEILSYWSQNGAGRPLSVVLPGGTCSTAALLHWAIKNTKEFTEVKHNIQVVVIPCVGDASYARRQMTSLYSQLEIDSDLPLILPPSSSDDLTHDYFSFGEPEFAILETFERMRDENNIVLDLLYGAPSWSILLRHLRPGRWNKSPLFNREIMYVHSGGLEGINSQLLRYKYKGLIDIEDIQLPGKSSPGN